MNTSVSTNISLTSSFTLQSMETLPDWFDRMIKEGKQSLCIDLVVIQPVIKELVSLNLLKQYVNLSQNQHELASKFLKKIRKMAQQSQINKELNIVHQKFVKILNAYEESSIKADYGSLNNAIMRHQQESSKLIVRYMDKSGATRYQIRAIEEYCHNQTLILYTYMNSHARFFQKQRQLNLLPKPKSKQKESIRDTQRQISKAKYQGRSSSKKEEKKRKVSKQKEMIYCVDCDVKIN